MEAICKECGAVYSIAGEMPGHMICTCECKEFEITGIAQETTTEI